MNNKHTRFIKNIMKAANHIGIPMEMSPTDVLFSPDYKHGEVFNPGENDTHCNQLIAAFKLNISWRLDKVTCTYYSKFVRTIHFKDFPDRNEALRACVTCIVADIGQSLE